MKKYKYLAFALAILMSFAVILVNGSRKEEVVANGGEGDRVDVGIELKIKKTDPEGNPLKGVKFKLYNETYKTDENGDLVIPVYKHPDGFAALIEEGQVIDGAEYEGKVVNIDIKERCYDGVCFHGEVKGTDFITYKDLKTKVEADGKTIGTALELGNDKADGGNWLKFTDSKYKDAYDRPRVFYIAKKPVTNNVSWDMLFNAGVVYGLDTVDKDGNILSGVTGVKADYKPKFIKVNGKKYIVRLLQGKTNFNVDKNKAKVYGSYAGIGSEWNRSIVAVTKQYRGEEDSLEQALKDGNSNYEYVNNNYKVQLASYNWFGDLTLGADETYQYNEKVESSVGSKGQFSWCQEVFNSAESRARCGTSIPDYGAATSDYPNSSDKDAYDGFRPVLEEVPLEYDGMIFDGEVKGTDFITYKDLKTRVEVNGKKVGTELGLGNDTADGGNWLKFTDTKYNSNGKPRTFYVAKKPVANNVSWDELFDAGVVYGPDKINSDGTIKSDATEIQSGYKGKIITIKGKKYIVRLIRGVSNGDASVRYKSGATDYDYDDARNSEWNRSIVAVTKQYRGEASSMEQALKDGNNSYKYVDNDYKIQLHNYNWFGDLTLGAWNNYQYDGQPKSSVGGKGQYSWCQEYKGGSSRYMRGSRYLSGGAAYSYSSFSDNSNTSFGWRPVLELID